LPSEEGENCRELHPSVTEGLARLECSPKEILAITRHISGTRNLEKAPEINHATLYARGFTSAEIEKLEDHLPQATSLRHACTPWVVGVEFCREVLKIPAAKIDDLRFNLLAHLGFNEIEIKAADAYCYGHGSVEGAAGLRLQQAAVFATAASLPPEAHIRMAAAVQGFLSGTCDLHLVLPEGIATERLEKLILEAWRRGVKSLDATFDPCLRADEAKVFRPATMRRKTAPKITASAFLHTKAPALPKRRARSAAVRSGNAAEARLKPRSIVKAH